MLPPDIPGFVVEVHEELPSTNTRCRRLVEAGEAPERLVVLAERQSAGRGRRGRTWHTLAGRSLALSLARPLGDLVRPTRLTVLAAVAACRALEAQGAADLQVKWPNDLLRGGRKIGGLLAELPRDPAARPWLVLGLGLNLELRAGDGLPPDVELRAGDAGLGSAPTLRADLARGFVREFEEALAQLGTDADRARGEEYRRRSWLIGRTVDLVWRGEPRRERILDVTADGDLVFSGGRVARGEHVELRAGSSA